MHNKSSSTRDEILNMLKFQRKLTVTEMAKHLEITEMAVRRHLNTLERDRYIETELVRQAMGRPIHVYRLTEEGEELFPRNYRSIAIDFIKDIEDIGGNDVINQLFERRQERLKEQYRNQLASKPFDEKIHELAKIQNDNGYMVKVDKEEDGSYRFIEYNCPISQIAEQYNKACNCELDLFKEVLGTDQIERDGCIGQGGECCDYIIKEKEK